MNRFAIGAVLLLLLTIAANAQQPPLWAGNWTLDVTATDRAALAAFGQVPDSQRLRLQRTDTSLEIEAETTLAGEASPRREKQELRIDGTSRSGGPITLRLASQDDSMFEIVTSATVGSTNLTQVSRFVVSQDGATLTETKARTGQMVRLERATSQRARHSAGPA